MAQNRHFLFPKATQQDAVKTQQETQTPTDLCPPSGACNSVLGSKGLELPLTSSSTHLASASSMCQGLYCICSFTFIAS